MLFKLANFEILPYNIFSVIAYATAAFIFYVEAKRKKIPAEIALYVLLGALFGGLIGSRLGSAFFVYRAYYFQNFLNILLLQLGGKTLIGGLLGGYAGVVVTKMILRFRRSTGDLFAPGIAVGISIGRIGCFFNNCCYGMATAFPWGINFSGVRQHPTQIYESILCLVLFIYLWKVRKRVKKEGDLFKIVIFVYAIFRFWVEFLRADAVAFVFGASLAQFICLLAIVILGSYFIRRMKSGIFTNTQEGRYGEEGLY